MKKSYVTFDEFCDSFGEQRKNNFSFNGKRALFDYLEEFEEATGEEIELDPVAFCCDFTEYEDLKEFQSDYGKDYKSIEDIEEKTIVIPVERTEGFIIQSF